MKKLIAVLSIILFSFSCAFAQSPQVDTTQNGFLGQLHFVNGKAEVIIRVAYYDIHRAAPLVGINGHPEYPYDRKTLLNEHIYSGTEISFKLKRDTTVKSVPLVAKTPFNNHLEPGTLVYLTCVVFKGYKNGYGTFFIVKDVSTTDPNKKATSN